jgi:hypothetical protein
MKKILLAMTIAIFGGVALDRVPGQEPSAYAFTAGDDKKKDDKKKDPPGPPVVRDKQPKPKDPPPPPKKP